MVLLDREPLKKVISLLAKIPGVGEKSARRYALFLLQQPKEYALELARAIIELKEKTGFCPICGNIASSEGDLCAVCSDPTRDRKTLCVLESLEDLINFEQSGVYSGLYFVLGGRISPMEGEDLDEEQLEKLKHYVVEKDFKEVIIATNPKVEGDLTFYAVYDVLKDCDVAISRLAFGLPVGGSIGYADRVTLHASLDSRMAVNGGKKARRE
ncbi:recombination mediator RecR [Thermovirga sp.]|uniref:recombination mediator RecR n=1 Tax=Thermovirga sp. TaxID=2699834 RepID=UPI003458F90E|nr:recombination protein RecR [Thermovirga sp.]